jgi:hypothetical protein
MKAAYLFDHAIHVGWLDDPTPGPGARTSRYQAGS